MIKSWYIYIYAYAEIDAYFYSVQLHRYVAFPPASSVDMVARRPCDPPDGLSGGDQPLVDTGEWSAAGVMGG